MWRHEYTSPVHQWAAEWLGIHLYPWQRAAMEDPSRYKLVLHGRQVGSSTAIAVDALRRASTDNTNILIYSLNSHIGSLITMISGRLVASIRGNYISIGTSRIYLVDIRDAKRVTCGVVQDYVYVDDGAFIDDNIMALCGSNFCPVWVNYDPHMRGNGIDICNGYRRIVVESTGNYRIGGN